MLKVGDSVLEAPVKRRVSEGSAVRRVPGAPSLRRDLSEDFAEPRGREAEEELGRGFGGLRFRLRGGMPGSTVGKAVVAGGVLAVMLGVAAVLWGTRAMLLHEPRLVIESSSAIQITGNRHLSRPQLLSVFGEDVDRNILTVPLTERRAELERLPWVEHATVMRLLPNRFRVAIVERTPVAFVRQGSRIGLVDQHGVLLDMASDAEDEAGTATGDPTGARYSFPVVTGLTQAEPLATRAARMKLYARFTTELDAGGEKISKELSEVDLSNPEDVKALIPAGKSDILVHFGDKDFLHRYELYAKNLGGWQASYPRLASADMRYERQVVLEMQPGVAVPAAAPAAPAAVAAKGKVVAAPAKASKAVAKVGVAPIASAADPTHRKVRDEWGTQGSAVPKAAAPAGGHLQTAFDVPAKSKAKAVPQ